MNFPIPVQSKIKARKTFCSKSILCHTMVEIEFFRTEDIEENIEKIIDLLYMSYNFGLLMNLHEMII